jgi:hypothetical protein
VLSIGLPPFRLRSVFRITHRVVSAGVGSTDPDDFE